MNILVTGGAGFIGSHLVERLLAGGHRVTVIDNLSTGNVRNLPPDVRLLQYDVRSPLGSVFESAKPEIVFHLAAQVSVSESTMKPAEDLDVNVGGVINVMEAASRWGVRKVISLSSAAVYGNTQDIPIVEESATVPQSPYGLSKLTGEMYIRMLGQLRGVAFTILRPSNIFGPRQTIGVEGAVIPTFLNAFMSGHDPVIHGDGSQIRDFLYVDDLVSALMLCIDRADGLTLNLSSGVGTSILELWQIMAKLVNWSRAPVFAPSRVGDVSRSVLCNHAARKLLGWEPTYSLTQGLQLTIDYECGKNRVDQGLVRGW